MEHFQCKNHVIFPIFNERQNFCTMEDLLFTVFVCIYIYIYIYAFTWISTHLKLMRHTLLTGVQPVIVCTKPVNYVLYTHI